LRFAVAGASRSIETHGAQEHGLRAMELLPRNAEGAAAPQGSFERFKLAR
jgi:hypothetical protein